MAASDAKEMPQWLWQQVSGSSDRGRGDRDRDDGDQGHDIRLPASVRATLSWPTPAGAATKRNIIGLVRDISPTSIGIVLDRPMKRGELFVVHMPALGTEERKPVALGCMATRCDLNKSGSESWFVIGASFIALPEAPGYPSDRQRPVLSVITEPPPAVIEPAPPVPQTSLAAPSPPSELERLRQAILS